MSPLLMFATMLSGSEPPASAMTAPPATAPASDPPASAPPDWAADPSPQVVGALSSDQILTVMRSVQSPAASCYRALNAQHPEQAGDVEASFTVQADGLPAQIKTQGPNIKTEWFYGCLTDAIEDLRFPTAASTTAVSWTLPIDATIVNTMAIGGLIGAMGTRGGTTAGTGQVGGDPVILGALDKSLIDAVIKRNMNQIRYCYQRELGKNKTLSGKINVKFVIAKDGSVTSAQTKSTTMNNPNVESCINGRFMKFQFPEPKGGGIVIVTYPFVFEPG